MKTIKIAPSADDVRIEDNALKVEFANMNIEYRLADGMLDKFNHSWLKRLLCGSIAMCGRLWQLPLCFHNNGVEGECYVDGSLVKCPDMWQEINTENLPLEEIRHIYECSEQALLNALTKYLMDYDLDNPLKVDIWLEPDDCQGLSERDYPHIVEICQDLSQGLVFFRTECCDISDNLEVLSMPERMQVLETVIDLCS